MRVILNILTFLSLLVVIHAAALPATGSNMDARDEIAARGGPTGPHKKPPTHKPTKEGK